jgi:hypothetical protein
VTEFFPERFPEGRYYGRKLGVDAFSLEGTIAWGDQIYADMRAQALGEKPLDEEVFERAEGEQGSRGAGEQRGGGAGEQGRDPVDGFIAALVATLPPARERDAALAYHAVLRGTEAILPDLPPGRARLLHALIERSPPWRRLPACGHCRSSTFRIRWRRSSTASWPRRG